MQNSKIEIYTDGSCLGNPGPGGWGVLIKLNGEEIELAGGEDHTTNNRMEMTAIVKALEWVRNDSGVTEEDLPKLKIGIFSDSNLIIQTLNKGWKKKANTDIWAEMDQQRAWLDITWTWVKAHADNEDNNRADVLAFNAAQNIKKGL